MTVPERNRVMATKTVKRALGIKDDSEGSALDRETIEERYRALSAVKHDLVKQEQEMLARIEAAERQAGRSGGDRSTHALDLEMKAAMQQGLAGKARGARSVSGQQLELDLVLVIKELQRTEDAVAKEAKEWETRARERADVESRLKRKLASYPKRFMQNPEEVRREVRALEAERDQLQAAAREERAGLFEELQAMRTELGVQDAQLRSVEQELLEAEGDRDFWVKRYQKERVRNDMLSKNRASLLERVRPFHDGKGLEKVAYDRVLLAVAEGASETEEAYAEAATDALSQLLEPDVSVSVSEVLEYVHMVVATEGKQQQQKRDGLLGFDRFCRLVDQLEGKEWKTS